jgi:hypothetical protein
MTGMARVDWECASMTGKARVYWEGASMTGKAQVWPGSREYDGKGGDHDGEGAGPTGTARR